MPLPTDSSSWTDVITKILIGIYIAVSQFSAWKASRQRVVTQEKIDSVHTLVNGHSAAAAAKIAELAATVAELKLEKMTLIAAFSVKTATEPVIKETKP